MNYVVSDLSYTIVFYTISIEEMWWPSGRASDSGAGGTGFEPNGRQIVSMRKTF